MYFIRNEDSSVSTRMMRNLGRNINNSKEEVCKNG